jgi:hypothetical protein
MAKKKTPVNEPKQADQNVPAPPPPNTFEMFAKKQNTGFIAMTQQASMMADETAVKRKQESSAPSRINSCIHQIRKDK